MNLTLLVVLQIVTLALVVYLLLRKQPAPEQDPRMAQLAEQLTRLDARTQASDEQARAAFAQMRTDIATEAQRARDASAADFATLRTEITGSISTLGTALQTGLTSFREDNTSANSQLRGAVQQQMDALTQRLTSFTSETTRSQIEVRESLNQKLNDLMAGNTTHQEQIRSTVEARLDKLNDDNTSKLEQMRATVDEKLQSTLQTRLTESFGQVTEQLTKVHTGLGEMTKLSDGVSDLSRVFTNVKTRGQFAEAMLDNLLKQMLAPSQFVRNAQVKSGTQEAVEFAVRFPGPNGDVLMPIDSKFPRESWDRLESAYEAGTDIAAARKVFVNAIRTEAKRICSKYINEPVTTPNAVMFLPTEGLYAEVMRCDGLHDDIQQNCHVMIAGPSNLSAILTSFQMVFQLVNLQKKGNEVWKVLAAARGEFGKFGVLMDKMDKQVGTVQNTIRDLGTRTRAINRTLRDVNESDANPDIALEFDNVVPLLAASDDEE